MVGLRSIRGGFKNLVRGLGSINYLDKSPLPVLGIQDGKIVYINTTFSEEFFGDIKSVPQAFFSDVVLFKDELYSKTLLFTSKGIEFFFFVKDTASYDDWGTPNVWIDQNYNLFKANELFLEIIPTAIGQNFAKLIDEHSYKVLEEYVTVPAPHAHLELQLCDKNGTKVLAFIKHIHANPNIFAIYFVDITEYKSLEIQLIHAQKMQAIGQLAGGVAHDFNNLLTAMLGFCDLLLMKHPAGDPSFAEIMQIKQNANRAANLVRQLLAISRKQVMKTKVLDITDVLSDLASLLRRLIGENIKLDIAHGNDLKLIKADPGQLEQVIINLVVNARDAIVCVKSMGHISVRTRNVVIREKGKVEPNLLPALTGEKILPGTYVALEVIDDGCGIPKATISKIFEPFFSTKPVGAGTGLGLSTVYGIIKQSGGYLYIETREGEGTRFSVFLKTAKSGDTKEEIADVDFKLMQQDLTGNVTILLVEDEIPVRMVSSRALNNKGYKVLEASNAEDALEIVKSRQGDIDVIITDVIMPGMNGPTFVAEVHKMYPKIKVIFMSGYVEEAFSSTHSTDELGTFNFLPKPFTLQQLVLMAKEVSSSCVST